MKKKLNNQKDFYNKVFNHSLYFLKFRPRSEKEVRSNLQKYLYKFGLQEDDRTELINKTIHRLKDLKFVDDWEFAKYWIDQRKRSKPKGKKVIAFELRQKGIDNDLAEVLVEQEFSDNLVNDLINKLIEKADRKYQYLPYLERKNKLTQFLLRRGFSYEEIRPVIDEYVKKGVE